MWLALRHNQLDPCDQQGRRKQGTTSIVSTSLNYRSDLALFPSFFLSFPHGVHFTVTDVLAVVVHGRHHRNTCTVKNMCARAPKQTIYDVRTMLNAAQDTQSRHSHVRKFHNLSSRRFQTPHYLWLWGNVVGRGLRRRITNRFAAASSSRAQRRGKCPPGVSGEVPHFVQVARPDYTTTALTPLCDTSNATHFQQFAEKASTDRPSSAPRVRPRALPTHVSRHISFSKICLNVTYITLPPVLTFDCQLYRAPCLGNHLAQTQGPAEKRIFLPAVGLASGRRLLGGCREEKR